MNVKSYVDKAQAVELIMLSCDSSFLICCSSLHLTYEYALAQVISGKEETAQTSKKREHLYTVKIIC